MFEKKKNLNVVIIIFSNLLAQFGTEFTSGFLRHTKRLCCDTNEDEYAVHEAIGIVGKRQNLPFLCNRNVTFSIYQKLNNFRPEKKNCIDQLTCNMVSTRNIHCTMCRFYRAHPSIRQVVQACT